MRPKILLDYSLIHHHHYYLQIPTSKLKINHFLDSFLLLHQYHSFLILQKNKKELKLNQLLNISIQIHHHYSRFLLKIIQLLDCSQHHPSYPQLHFFRIPQIKLKLNLLLDYSLKQLQPQHHYFQISLNNLKWSHRSGSFLTQLQHCSFQVPSKKKIRAKISRLLKSSQLKLNHHYSLILLRNPKRSQLVLSFPTQPQHHSSQNLLNRLNKDQP